MPATASATPVPSSSGPRVTEVSLRADPATYSGPCPVTIRFSGRVTVAGGGGRVTYTFIRHDGAPDPVRTVSFAEPGAQEIGFELRLGGPNTSTITGWVALQILEPSQLRSAQAHVTVQCS